jgi:hypothetical protein
LIFELIFLKKIGKNLYTDLELKLDVF